MYSSVPIAERVHIFDSRDQMGRAAAAQVSEAILLALSEQETVRIVFAAAPSQVEFLQHLGSAEIDWSRVDAFHMDEYLGLPDGAPQRFGNWLRRHLFDQVPLRSVHLIDTRMPASDAAAAYAATLAEAAVDIVCCGVGVNGHLAFNDPPVARFDDPEDARVVDLDEVCRRQQVDDGCFDSLAKVPGQAITLTVPRLLRTRRIVCVVPGAAKRSAVTAMLTGPVSTRCPASALREHPCWDLFVDREALGELMVS